MTETFRGLTVVRRYSIRDRCAVSSTIVVENSLKVAQKVLSFLFLGGIALVSTSQAIRVWPRSVS